jgi:hypothetical protein
MTIEQKAARAMFDLIEWHSRNAAQPRVGALALRIQSALAVDKPDWGRVADDLRTMEDILAAMPSRTISESRCLYLVQQIIGGTRP